MCYSLSQQTIVERARDDKLFRMATRRPLARNNHLEEAMALLIRNQAAFVEQVARNDQERLALRKWQHNTERWQHQTEERLRKIEAALAEMPNTILQSVLEALPKIIIKDILDKLPKALKKEIGFKPQAAR